MTPETTSRPQVLKTPTTETSGFFTASTKPTSFKKSGKKVKLKRNQTPKENTTSPPESKAYPKVKTEPLVSESEHTREDMDPSYVKLHAVAQNPTNTPSKKLGKPQENNKSPSKAIKKEDPGKKLSTTTPSTPNPAKTEPTLTEQYHALVCYGEKNREIASELKTFLESECNLQVCIDFANYIPGKATTDNITESITSSGSVIFLLSPEFLEKLWAPWELKSAIYGFNASQKSKKPKKIIPVLLEECKVPDELKMYTPIKMEECDSKENCWRKLAAAVSPNGNYSDDDDDSADNDFDSDDDDDDVDDDDDHGVIDHDDDNDNSEGGLGDTDNVSPDGVDSDDNNDDKVNDMNNSNDDSSLEDDDEDDGYDDHNSEVDSCGDDHGVVSNYGSDTIIPNSANHGDVKSL